MHKKYFFFDIDGTLTSVKQFGKIPKQTQNAVRELQKQGHFVAIATGRPYYFAEEFLRRTSITHLVCNGGNDLYIDDRCIHHESLDREAAQQIINDCLRQNLAFCVSSEDSERRIAHNDAFIKGLGECMFRGQFEVIKDLDYAAIPAIERIYILIDEGKEQEVSSFQKLTPCRYGGKPYVIVEPDDKYRGIEAMMRHIGGKLEDVVVFGDGINDIRMFQKAPFSIAMGNAIPELKKISSFVTKSSDEDGITYALTHFGWLDHA